MKLRITSGELEVEVIEGSLTIDDVKGLLRNLSKEQIEEVATRDKISKAGLSPYSSKSGKQDKLNVKPKIPI